MLTLRRFLDCAYAILVEEYQRLGIDLLTAVDKLGDFAVGRRKSDGRAPETAAEAGPSEQSVVAQNQQAMVALEKMMGGVRA